MWKSRTYWSPRRSSVKPSEVKILIVALSSTFRKQHVSPGRDVKPVKGDH